MRQRKFVSNIDCNCVLNLIDLNERKGSYDVECFFKRNTKFYKGMNKIKHFIYSEDGYKIVNFWFDSKMLLQKNLIIFEKHLHLLAKVLKTNSIIVPDFFDMELWQIIYDVFKQHDISAFFIANEKMNKETKIRKFESKINSMIRNDCF